MEKRGFPVPLNDWLQQDKYYKMVKEKFIGDVASQFFDIDFIIKLLDDHKNGKAKNMKKIWTIYSFIIWYENYFIRNGEVA